MKNAQPLFDPTTHYRIEVRGPVDVDWLQRFEDTAEITFQETRQVEDITVLNMHTDQSGIIGLVRKLHSLGITILQVQVVKDGK